MDSWRDDLRTLGIPVPESFDLDGWVANLTNRPCTNTAALVGLSAVLFLASERGRNPRVKDIWDAALYCSTCLNVGYADIHPTTPIGKLLGAALMIVGPAAATKTLDGPRPATDPQQEVLATLREILTELKGRSPVTE